MPSSTALNTCDASQTSPPDVARAPAIPPDIAAATREDAEAERQPSKAEAPAIRPRRMLRYGANKAVNDAFFTLCDTYLAGDRPPTMQACAEAEMEQYEDGDLTAEQLADFVSAFYEAIGDHQDVSQEQAAWLSSVERRIDH